MSQRDLVVVTTEATPISAVRLSYVPEDKRKQLDDLTIRINRRQKDVVRSAIEQGLDLIEAKKIVGHKYFDRYIDQYVDVNRRMVEYYMDIARIFYKDVDRVASMPLEVLIELATHNNTRLTEHVVDAYSKGIKLARHDVAAVARRLNRDGTLEPAACTTSTSPSLDELRTILESDITSALPMLEFIQQQNLLPRLKKLKAKDTPRLIKHLKDTRSESLEKLRLRVRELAIKYGLAS